MPLQRLLYTWCLRSAASSSAPLYRFAFTLRARTVSPGCIDAPRTARSTVACSACPASPRSPSSRTVADPVSGSSSGSQGPSSDRISSLTLVALLSAIRLPHTQQWCAPTRRRSAGFHVHGSEYLGQRVGLAAALAREGLGFSFAQAPPALLAPVAVVQNRSRVRQEVARVELSREAHRRDACPALHRDVGRQEAFPERRQRQHVTQVGHPAFEPGQRGRLHPAEQAYVGAVVPPADAHVRPPLAVGRHHHLRLVVEEQRPVVPQLPRLACVHLSP